MSKKLQLERADIAWCVLIREGPRPTERFYVMYGSEDDASESLKQWIMLYGMANVTLVKTQCVEYRDK